MRTEHPLAIVIDDDIHSLDTLGVFLQEKGFVVIKFTDAERFFRLVPNIAFSPSVAIIDESAGGPLTYEDVVQECRRCKLTFPFVVLTQNTSRRAQLRAAEAGCHYLGKPIRPGILNALLDTVVLNAGFPRCRTA